MNGIVELKVNDDLYRVVAPPWRTLLEVLREDLRLTGTKEVCDTGECGACTVIIDGKATLACLKLAVEVQGKEITTIEGLALLGRLHPIQQAFVSEGAIQCGFCTPGMVLAGKALLDENPEPSSVEIEEAISGHLCRCTGYVKIVSALEAAAKNSN
ncbi:MAG: (2Fe-2S)-binding protein [Chloroflexi bacterium]|nr:(2Fe-2S)-binding protein [Chloroflexota bacterium]